MPRRPTRPKKSNAAPIACFDLETDPFLKGRHPLPFAAGVTFDGEACSLFWGADCVSRLCEMLFRAALAGPFIAFAHNGGKFDFYFLLPHLVKKYGAENIKLFCVGTRIVQIKLPGWEMRDSFAIIPRPLKDLGTASKNKKEIDFAKLEIGVREKHRPEILEYLSADCTALFAVVNEFRETYGKRALTLASAANTYMRENYEIRIPETNRRFDETFRPFYFGGRVEFFHLGKVADADLREIKVYDINSAYPKAMLSPHWWTVDYRATTVEPKKNFEQSLFEIECESRGAFPLRAPATLKWKNNGREFRATKGAVCFPHGFHRFKVTGWELKAARDLGLISREKVIACYVPNGVQAFGEYISHFYEMKKNAETDGQKNFAKLFLNGYYGKTATNPRKFCEFRLGKYGERLPDWELSHESEYNALSFHKRPAETDPEKMRYKNVAAGASVTGFVRAMLLRAIHSCEKVYYCDTDSIVGEGCDKLPVGKEIGEWKLEAEVVEAHFAGKKVYAMRDKNGKPKLASKGVRLSFDQIAAVAAGECAEYTFDAPNFSVSSPSRFTTRKIRRDDLRDTVKPKKKNARK